MPIFRPRSVLTLPEKRDHHISRLNAIDEDLLRQARSFWDRVRGNRSMPNLSDIDPVEMPRTILPHIFLSNVLEHPRSYVCRLAGTMLEEHLGPLKGKTLDKLHFGAKTSDILRLYDDTVSHRAPSDCCYDFIGADNRRYHFKGLLMPLSPNNKDVQWLFGIVLFFSRQAPPLNPVAAGVALIRSWSLSLR
jgi:hypothetical protein